MTGPMVEIIKSGTGKKPPAVHTIRYLLRDSKHVMAKEFKKMNIDVVKFKLWALQKQYKKPFKLNPKNNKPVFTKQERFKMQQNWEAWEKESLDLNNELSHITSP